MGVTVPPRSHGSMTSDSSQAPSITRGRRFYGKMKLTFESQGYRGGEAHLLEKWMATVLGRQSNRCSGQRAQRLTAALSVLWSGGQWRQVLASEGKVIQDPPTPPHLNTLLTRREREALVRKGAGQRQV